jgi:Ca-activated chloride channel homolog
MSFIMPKLLFLLALLPFLVAAYLKSMRRRKQRSEQLAAQGFTPSAAALKLRRRRHIPFVFFGTAIALLVIGVARPQTTLNVPRREGTVILAFDISNSMRADDLAPTRMDAAKTAAQKFVAKQPPSINIGVVAFSDGALITQQPTTDRTALLATIRRISARGGTSLGKGIFTSLNAISGKPIDVDPDQLGKTEDAKIGYFSSAAIVLLTDGENNNEPDPLEIAKLASVAGVKIYPVGVGSPNGTIVKIDGFSISTVLNAELLTNIAKVTNGRYFEASDATSLSKIYESIDLKWKVHREHSEMTALFTGISAFLLAIGAFLSVLWFGRVV